MAYVSLSHLIASGVLKVEVRNLLTASRFVHIEQSLQIFSLGHPCPGGRGRLGRVFTWVGGKTCQDQLLQKDLEPCPPGSAPQVTDAHCICLASRPESQFPGPLSDNHVKITQFPLRSLSSAQLPKLPNGIDPALNPQTEASGSSVLFDYSLPPYTNQAPFLFLLETTHIKAASAWLAPCFQDIAPGEQGVYALQEGD